MGRGVSSGGGQSSLGYLFGSDEPAKCSRPSAPPPPQQQPPAAAAAAAAAATPPPAGISRNHPTPTPTHAPAACKHEENGDAGVVKLGRNNNNYHRADGQNTGNFITDRPSTKVHSAPGGGSSLGYLFGGK